jgi:hypothetical protein
MSLSPQEIESKAQMLANPDPNDPYVIPPDIVGIDRARIEARADVIRRQNASIARFNPPATAAPAPAAILQSILGGKRRKSKRSKKNKSKRNKSRSRR